MVEKVYICHISSPKIHLYMKAMSTFFRTVTILLFILSYRIQAQPRSQVGTVYSRSTENGVYHTYAMFNDFVMAEIFPPGYQGPPNIFSTSIDPSWQVFRVLPAANPHQKGYFIDWNNNVVELSIDRPPTVVGVCQCPPAPRPFLNLPQPTYSPTVGVETPNGFSQLPVEVARPYENTPYGNVMITSEQQAQQCYQQSLTSSGLDRNRFTECMVEKMSGARELAIFNCVRSSQTPEQKTLCLLGILGGDKEKLIAQQLSSCMQAYGSDYSKYPLCLAGENVDGDLGKVIKCMEEQSRTGQVSVTGTAVCYGLSSLNLNPETLIILQCAATSGGNPYVFAGCAGGQLVTRELDKCFTNGVGGSNGCFGENNEIVRGLAAIGRSLDLEFGPGNDFTRNWNNAVRDITQGPGQNHEAVKAFRDVGNEMDRAARNANAEVARAATNVSREIKRAVPKITIRW